MNDRSLIEEVLLVVKVGPLQSVDVAKDAGGTANDVGLRSLEQLTLPLLLFLIILDILIFQVSILSLNLFTSKSQFDDTNAIFCVKIT